MSDMDHQSTVDRGLRMKIKRTKNMGPTSNKIDTKHEIVKSGDKPSSSSGSCSGGTDGVMGANGPAVEKTKQAATSDKDKSPKVKSSHKKERFGNKGEKFGGKSGDAGPTSLSSVSTSLDLPFSQVSLEPKQGEVAHGKRESVISDPYEFNAKVEDGLDFPMKKIKTEKVDTCTATSIQHTSGASSSNQNASTCTETCSVGVATDPECLGPCEPGTSVTLEGIVWHETENGVLVVNVTWRDKTYVGTLLDATRHDWAPPRFNCESPVSEFETRTPKGRAKRGRATCTTPVDLKGPEGRKLRKGRKGSNTFQAPPSPAKSDVSSSGGVKRKGRPTEIDLSANAASKRSRSCSQSTTPGTESPVSSLIECPEPNCGKKYKHMNGLRYHQTHAHQSPGPVVTDGEDDTRDTCDNNEDSVMDDFEGSIADASETNDSAIKSTSKQSADSVNNEDEDDDEEEEVSSNKKEEEEIDEVKSDHESVNDNVDVGNSVEQKSSDSNKSENSSVAGQPDKKDVTVSSSIASSVVGKPIVSIPSGNAFQIVSSQHVAPTTFGSIGLLSQAAMTPGVVQTNPVPLTGAMVTTSPIQSAIPITVTAISSSSAIHPIDLKTDQSSATSKTEKPIRPRISRPIIPQIPQIVALSTTVAVTHTNMNPVATPSTQLTSTLKPIQPKPLAPGELPPVNPAIFRDLKEKKVKPKKRDKKELSSTSTPTSSTTSTGSSFGSLKTGKVEPIKNEQSGVIKVAPIVAKPIEQPNKPEISLVSSARPAMERPDKPLSVTTSSSNVGVVTAQVQPSPKGIDLSQTSRQTDPPSVLKVQCSPLDNKSNINDNVQSPSYYSDISDESGSPATQLPSESPSKNKEESVPKPRESSGNPTGLPGPPGPGMDSQSGVPPYNMYGSYYGQSSYLLPTNLSSPSSSSGSSQQQSQQQQQAKSQQLANKDRTKPGPTDPKMKREDSKESENGTKEDKPGEKSDGTPRPLTQQEFHLLQHQKWVQQQMYARQIPPHAQYQFLASYAPYFESYHMHNMMNDPHYRMNFERSVEEEKRAGRMEGKEGSDSSKFPSGHRTPGVLGMDSPSGEGLRVPQLSHEGHKEADPKRSATETLSERESKEKSMREKQNENHQIIKENIDLKDQMDKNRFDQSRFDSYSGSRDKNTNEEQARRVQMYQQQALIRHQKREEHQKKLEGGAKFDGHRPGSDPGKSAGSSGSVHSATDNKPRDHTSGDSNKPGIVIKREPLDHVKPPAGSENSDLKSSNEDKFKNSSSSSVDRMRGLETPKSKQNVSAKVSSPHTPTSVPSSASQSLAAGGSPYSPYVFQNQYMQQASYGQIPFDASHPMYRGINPAMNMMYAGAYIHPSQLPYRVGMEVDDKEKLGLGQKLPTDSASDSKISDVPHGPQFQGGGSAPPTGHKIHELQEKNRSSPHRASPLPTPNKSEGTPTTPTSHLLGDKGREYSSSPPTQRHVHTHHHTHVVEAAYPVYPYTPDPYTADPYTNIFPGASQQKTPPSAAILPQQGHSQFPPK